MPSLRSNKNKWSLPPYPPTVETICIPVSVPNDPRWIGLFLGALYRLTQQVWYDRDEAKTARLVAAVWQDIYLATVKRIWGCEGGMFDIRVSPTDECSIEKTLDGETWVEAFRLDTDCALTRIIRNPNTGEYGWEVEDVGFYKFPDGPYVPNAPVYAPPPRSRAELENVARCDASYAAALALQSLYQQTWDVFTTTMADSALSFSKALIDLFEVIPALSIPLDWMLERAEDGLEGSTQFTAGGFPDTSLSAVQNILFCRSTVVDSRVYFDHAGVLSDFQSETGSPYDGLAFLLYLYINEDMLNAAGNIDAGSGDCTGAPCDWCYDFDFTAGDGDFSRASDASVDPEFGTWASGSGWNSDDSYNDPINAQVRGIYIERLWSPRRVNQWYMNFDWVGGMSWPNLSLAAVSVQLRVNGTWTYSYVRSYSSMTHALNQTFSATVSLDDCDGIRLFLRTAIDQTVPYTMGGECRVTGLLLNGEDGNPFGDDNC